MPTMGGAWPGPELESVRDGRPANAFASVVGLRVSRVLRVLAGGLGILFPARQATGGSVHYRTRSL